MIGPTSDHYDDVLHILTIFPRLAMMSMNGPKVRTWRDRAQTV